MSKNRFTLIYVDLENADADDGDGHDLFALHDAAIALAKDRNIGITSDRFVSYVALDGDMVVGASFSSFEGENYAFDIIVSKDYEGQGIGTMLTDAVISARKDYTEAFPESSMLVHVISDEMQKILAKKGFVVTERVPNGIIMGPGDECIALSMMASDDPVKSL